MKRLFAPILSALFAGGSYVRWKLFRWGIKRACCAPAPVVSIGNIALGGTGKTPCAIWLARALRDRGYFPAILTRGYGRSSRRRLIFEGDIPTARLAGDEPALMAEKLPEIPIAVHPDRCGSAREIGGGEGRLFILDDGFQHLRLARDFDLVLLPAGKNPFSGGHFFPWGRLRDGLWRLQEADAILMVGEGNIPAELRFLAPDVPVFEADKAFTGLKTLAGKAVPPMVLSEIGVIAFAGIASPQSFVETVKGIGAQVRGTLWFGDHHRFKTDDLRRVEKVAERFDADILVTTEKDAVRMVGLEPRLETYIVSIELKVKEEDKLLNLILEKTIDKQV